MLPACEYLIGLTVTHNCTNKLKITVASKPQQPHSRALLPRTWSFLKSFILTMKASKVFGWADCSWRMCSGDVSSAPLLRGYHETASLLATWLFSYSWITEDWCYKRAARDALHRAVPRLQHWLARHLERWRLSADGARVSVSWLGVRWNQLMWHSYASADVAFVRINWRKSHMILLVNKLLWVGGGVRVT